MKHMVSYTLKPDQVAENERLVAAVFDALHRSRPEGLRYATFRLADGVSFVHIVSQDDGMVGPALPGFAAFQAFAAGIGQRCVAPPVRIELTELGSYGFFGD